MGKNLEATCLKEANISYKDVTVKSFIPLLCKRFTYFLLKCAGSRTMVFLYTTYIETLILMWVFATKGLTLESMQYIFYLHISFLVFIAIMFGLIKFDDIKTEIKLGGK